MNLDQTARIWNADTGRCLLSYTGHAGSVNSVAIYPETNTDEILVLTASGDQSAHLWKSSRKIHVLIKQIKRAQIFRP